MFFPKVLLTFCSDLNLLGVCSFFSHAQTSQKVLSVFCIDFRFSSQLVCFFLDAFCFTCFSSGPRNSACRRQVPKESNSRNESRSNNFVTKWMGTSWATQKWGVWKKTVNPHMHLLYIVSVFFLFLVCSLFSVIFPVSFSLRYCSSDASKSKELATKRTARSAVTTKWGVCIGDEIYQVHLCTGSVTTSGRAPDGALQHNLHRFNFSTTKWLSRKMYVHKILATKCFLKIEVAKKI